MENLSRRKALSLGVALGLAGVAGPAEAWASTGSVTGADAGTGPEWIWDDAADPLMVSMLDNGHVPAINTAWASWVNNNDPLPTGLPAEFTAYLGQVNRLPSWADPVKLARAADFNRRRDMYLFMLYGLGSGIMSTVIRVRRRASTGPRAAPRCRTVRPRRSRSATTCPSWEPSSPRDSSS